MATPLWLFEVGHGTWHALSATEVEWYEAALQAGHDTVTYVWQWQHDDNMTEEERYERYDYEIDLKNMTQLNKTTKKTRRLARILPGPGQWCQ